MADTAIRHPDDRPGWLGVIEAAELVTRTSVLVVIYRQLIVILLRLESLNLDSPRSEKDAVYIDCASRTVTVCRREIRALDTG